MAERPRSSGVTDVTVIAGSLHQERQRTAALQNLAATLTPPIARSVLEAPSPWLRRPEVRCTALDFAGRRPHSVRDVTALSRVCPSSGAAT